MESKNYSSGIPGVFRPELVIIILLLSLLLGGCGREAKAIEIVFIHNNPCESCNEEEHFQEILQEVYPEEGSEAVYRVKSYYAYHEQGRELVEQAEEYFSLEKREVVYPIVLIGDTCLLGYSQIRQELASCMEKAVEEGSWEVVALAETEEKSGYQEQVMDAGEDVFHILYFHTEICPKCEEAEEFLSELPDSIMFQGQEYPLVVTSLSVAEENNALFFGKLSAQRNVPEREQQVPFLFLGDSYLSGENQIRQQTYGLLEAGKGLGVVYRADGDVKQQENPAIFLLKTVGVGFLNGFNPCALSIVLLFFSLIASLPKGFLRHGFAFLAGKFIAYVMLGMVAVAFFSAIPFGSFLLLRRGMNVLLLSVCLCLAIGNFADCYHAFRGEYGKIKMQLPGRLRTWNDKLVKQMVEGSGKKAFLLMIFWGSMLIALGEFFCTGQIYLASILQWIQQAENGSIPVLALILYSGALCLPALFLLLLIARGKSTVALTNKSLKGVPLIKLCNGILFVVFAIMAVAYL